MNYAILFRLLSVICLVLGIGFLLSLGVAVWLDGSFVEDSRPVFGFSIAVTVSLACALVLRQAGRTAEKKIFMKEALATVGTGWLLASLLGALPYLLILPSISFGDAFFESTSGITTTGASVLADVESLPRSLLFWRQLSQWMGGLGVVVFFVALLGSLGIGGKVLFANESTGSPGDLDFSRMQEGARSILLLYLALSLACVLLYRLVGMPWFDAVGHMFTTVSTSGFSTRNESIGAFQSPGVEWVCIAFMILGGTNFVFLMALMRGRFRKCRQHTEVKAYGILLLAATLYATAWLHFTGGGGQLMDTFRNAAFQVVSVSTTSGFATQDFDLWPTPVVALLVFLMVVGGSSGSTAGGSKAIRWVVLAKIFRLELETAFRPNLVRAISINGHTLDRAGRDEVLHFFIILIGVFAISYLIVSALEPGMDPFSSLTAVVACLFNIGPGLGSVGPTKNFGFLGEPVKIYLSLLMILGRLEFFALLVLFFPSLWRNFR